MKCLQFLVHVFLDCKLSFACFDWNTVLSAGYGCHISPARGTREFRFAICPVWQPAQIHIHVQMRLAGTSCASVAGCQTKFRVPLTALIMHPHFGEPCSTFVKHWKDGFYHRKKNMHFRTAVFYSRKRYF